MALAAFKRREAPQARSKKVTKCVSRLQSVRMTASKKKSMPARAPRSSATSAPTNNSSSLLMWLASALVLLVGALLVGGYWLQTQRVDSSQQRQHSDIYERDVQYTRTPPSAAAPAASSSRTEAQATRHYVLNHPAATPGSAFDQPGVQATGKTILQAIDQAKGL